jgi:hypothetical protein
VGEGLGKDKILGMKDENKKAFVSLFPEKVFILQNSSIILTPEGDCPLFSFLYFLSYVSLKYN